MLLQKSATAFESIFVFRLFQSLGELVRAGCTLKTATNAGKALDDFVNGHSVNQARNPLRVAVAAAVEADVINVSVNNVKRDVAGANALGLL